MRIVVCIKQVPVVAAMELDPQTLALKREGVRTEVSAFDLRAVVKAVDLARAHGGEVTVLTMGPPQAREALLECLALGADRAVHLCDRAFAGSDTLATARALAAALRRTSFDLVLCGRNSTDAETGQVGPEVAELLDLPQVTSVRSLEVDPGTRTLRAERETDEGFETVVASLPALVTAAEDIASERFPNRAAREAAVTRPIEELRAADLDVPIERLGAAGSPTWVAGLQALEETRAGEIVTGESPEAAVEALVARLLRIGLFRSLEVEQRRPAAEGDGPVQRASARDVLVVGEVLAGSLREVTLELVQKGAQLARRVDGSVSVLLLGDGLDGHVAALAAHGATRVLLAAAAALRRPDSEAAADILTRIVCDERPGMVLLPSTVFGRDVAPRVAARLGIGLTGDCIDLGLDAEGRLLQYKPAFGGRVVAPILSRTVPEMTTVRPGILGVTAVAEGGRAEVIRLPGPEREPRVRVVATTPIAEPSSVLDHAEIVVGFGKGIGSRENLHVVEDLAAVLGAPLCTTRDVTEAGWVPKHLQVGMTGRAIAPKLYIAIGIRGAFEHMVGVRRAGTIVGVNKNAKAPLFKSADLGLVEDFAVVVPLLTERLRAARAGMRPA